VKYPVEMSTYGDPKDYDWGSMKRTPDMVKRKVQSVLMLATRQDPPHLIDMAVLNDQMVEIWFTIEPYAEDNADVVAEKGIQGWDIKFKLFRTFPWTRISDAKVNSVNYNRVTHDVWKWRMHKTNLESMEEMYTRQSKGIYWR